MQVSFLFSNFYISFPYSDVSRMTKFCATGLDPFSWTLELYDERRLIREIPELSLRIPDWFGQKLSLSIQYE